LIPGEIGADLGMPTNKDRSAPHLWIGEIVATAGLLMLIFALVRSGRAPVAARRRPLKPLAPFALLCQQAKEHR
jgi:hypothetical protein